MARRTISFSRSVEIHEKVIEALSKNTCSSSWVYYPVCNLEQHPGVSDEVTRTEC
ncbi:hypothetical protein QTU98_004669 [Enterobacter asburiae]|nr:hypothetical protein [Enterobacter asburiae]EMA4739904.1 hypothetical protein [Enterobacter asburiae]